MNHHPDYDDLFDGMETADEKDEGYTPRERPVDVAADLRRNAQAVEEGYERALALIEKKAKRREELTAKKAPSTATKETARAGDVPRRPDSGKSRPRVTPETPASPAGNQPPPATDLPGTKGQLLHHWEKKGVTWTVHLVASELQTGFKIILIRVQPWKRDLGLWETIKGPGCGFSMGPKEAETFIGALQAGLKKIKSKEFDPRMEGNFVPYQRDQK
jgi:hypothetical protein